MKTKDAITAVGGIKMLCKMLGCSRAAVYQWGPDVPAHRQYELEVKTGGQLQSDYTQNAKGSNHE
ncbi:Cro/Cl family transcriptional regulator [Pectobacterium aroidearum]|uniref:Cro/Cl family transcriptional regulator n=1 Tax=Pectobacterium aroidearum TaxID=1201031 RepID=A0ABR5ZJX1_9GAMM|nr:Cro/CI family transcriptional regulator [Pectobacterium aroidearum]MBA5234788.1 Cro/Cl family transcriptional regulator [Pectobacterium aroidearum]MBA5739967.1 Cro/Cl family transcriptional regulator [Pectobacterium aroidearum]